MERRTFMALVSGGLLAAPLAADAQQAGRMPRIGYLGTRTPRRLGWIEGGNIVVEQLRWGDRSPASLQKLAQDIVRLKLELVIASTDQHVTATKAATTTIPIVMVYAQDPVGLGFISSLARPGGNITVLTWNPGPELRGKLA
jgi:putative tryptophan/tyrosine transport system substrate-binding protein